MSANLKETKIRTTGQLRASLGRLLSRLEDGTVDVDSVNAACKVAQAINQSFAEETKAILAAKEIGQLQVGFGHTLISEPEEEPDKPKRLSAV